MYGTVAKVSAAFDSDQWDPSTDDPDTDTVTAWLDEASDVIDGEIAHVVTTPVDADDSPQLAAVLDQVAALRVRAQVEEMVYRGEDSERAKGWKAEANRLIKGIQGGAIADGASLGGRTPDHTGAPVGDFGAATGHTSQFGIGQKF